MAQVAWASDQAVERGIHLRDGAGLGSVLMREDMAAMTIIPFPDITNPADPRVTAAITWTCDICKAKRGHPCTCPICRQPLTVHGRIIHYGRLIDRRRENKEDE